MPASSGAIRAGRAFVELFGKDDQLTRVLKRAQQKLKAFGAGVRRIGRAFAAIGTAGLLPLLAAVKIFKSSGDALDKMAKRTGVSVETLSELGFAGEQCGAGLETLEKGVRTMQRAITDLGRGLSTQVDAFDELGLAADDLEGLLPEQQFKLIADRLSKIEDPSKRAALAMMIFGRAGTQLLPMLANGAAGIEALQEEARALGLTISTETAADAAELTDTWNRLWRVLKNGAFVIGSALAPLIISLTRTVMRITLRVVDWIKRNRQLVVGAAKILALFVAVGAALFIAGGLIAAIAAGFGVLATIVSTVGAVLGVVVTVLGALLSPIGLAIVAVVALGAAILKWTGAGSAALTWLSEKFGKLRDFVGDIVGGIVDALAAGDIALAVKVLWAGLKVAWQKGTDGLERLWINFSSGFQKVAINAFSGVRKAWIEVRDFFERNFPNFTAALSKTWTNFTSAFREGWAIAQNWIADRWLELMGMFDESLDVGAAQKLGADQLAEQLVGIEDERAKAIAEAERRRTRSDAEREAEKAAALAEVDAQRQQALKQLDERKNERLRQAEQELADARRELDEARARAAEQRAAGGGAGAGGAGPLGADFDELLERLESAGTAIAAKTGMTVRGTFNAAAIQGLLAESQAAERTADATEETARNTKRIERAIQQNGAVFT